MEIKKKIILGVSLLTFVKIFDNQIYASLNVLPPPKNDILGWTAYMTCTEGLAKSTNPRDFSKIEQCLFKTKSPQLNFKKQFSISSFRTWCSKDFQRKLKLTNNDSERVGKICEFISERKPGNPDNQKTPLTGGSKLPPPIQNKLDSTSAYMKCTKGLAESTKPEKFSDIEQCLFNTEKTQVNFKKALSNSAVQTWCNPSFQNTVGLTEKDLYRTDRLCIKGLGITPPDVCPLDMNGGNREKAPDGNSGDEKKPPYDSGRRDNSEGNPKPILPSPIGGGKLGSMSAYMKCTKGLASSPNIRDFAKIEKCVLGVSSPQKNFLGQLRKSAQNTWCSQGFQGKIRATEIDLQRIGNVCRVVMNGGNREKAPDGNSGDEKKPPYDSGRRDNSEGNPKPVLP